MHFKKYSDYLNEKKDKDSKDIEEVEIPKPDLDPEIALACPKCGSSSLPCKCFTEDYYNAKLGQQTPRPGKTVKNIKKKENE
jgi:uncharacterized C2H2 Zn-finger protein